MHRIRAFGNSQLAHTTNIKAVMSLACDPWGCHTVHCVQLLSVTVQDFVHQWLYWAVKQCCLSKLRSHTHPHANAEDFAINAKQVSLYLEGGKHSQHIFDCTCTICLHAGRSSKVVPMWRWQVRVGERWRKPDRKGNSMKHCWTAGRRWRQTDTASDILIINPFIFHSLIFLFG